MGIDWKALFLSLHGRIGRGPFWIGFLIIMAISFVSGALGPFAIIVGLALIWPNMAVTAKRLHDMGRSAWWIAAAILVITLASGGAALSGGATLLAALGQEDNQAIARATGGVGLTLLFAVIALVTPFAFLFWVGLSRGDPEANAFGPPPPPLP